MNNRRPVGPRVLLHRRSLVRRRCCCEVPVLTKYGWRLFEPFSSTRPLEGGDESSSKRVRSLAGMLSDWQHSIQETRTSELSDDQHDQHDNTDHMQQLDRHPRCVEMTG